MSNMNIFTTLFRQSAPWWVRKDINAVVALLSDNLSTILAYIVLVSGTNAAFSGDVGMEIVYGKILPGTGLAIFWGNMWYFFQAQFKSIQTGRTDLTAQPYGINTPSLYAFYFSITLDILSKEKTIWDAYYTTVASNLICGILIVILSPFAKFIQKHTPAVGLLSAISGIAIAYLTLGNTITVFKEPMAGLVSLIITFVGTYCLKVSGQAGPVPISIIAILWGSAVCWIQGGCNVEGQLAQTPLAVKKSFENMKWQGIAFPVVEIVSYIPFAFKNYIGYIIPIVLQTMAGTITSVQLAKNNGDEYDVTWSMIGDGMGTVIAALCGSTLTMTTYPNHPGYKQLGGRVGYSWMVSIMFLFMCLFGILAPFLQIFSIYSIVPGIIFVGLMISTATLSICKPRHYIAFIFGILPSLADWKNDFSMERNINEGNLIVGLVWSSMLYYMTERQFIRAAGWSVIASFLSFIGLIHVKKVQIQYTDIETGWKFTISYLQTSLVFLICYIAQCRGLIERPIDMNEAPSMIGTPHGFTSSFSGMKSPESCSSKKQTTSATVLTKFKTESVLV